MNLYRFGKILTYAGVLVWVPYFWLEYVRDAHPPFWLFLTIHLCGVIPGAVLTRIARRRKLKESRP